MYLAIDIGNTNTVLGIFDEQELLLDRRLVSSHTRTVDEYWLNIKLLCEDAGVNPKELKGGIISSVVPVLTNNFIGMAEKYLYFDPLVVDHTLKLDFEIQVEQPETMGADRICNIAGALEQYDPPLIVIDFGTATSFEVINRAGNYIGGAISPGLRAGSEQLVKKAAKLHTVDLKYPERIIGTNTREALQSGVYAGKVCMIEGMIDKMKNEANLPEAKVLATGGLAEDFARQLDLTPDPDLTLKGSKYIYFKNR